MQKRGQITTFIIVGIIVLFISAMAIYMRNQIQQPLPVQPEKVSVDVAPVQVFVAGCLKNVGDEGIVKNSLRGGYYTNFEQQIISMPNFNFVPVYFDGYSATIPTEEKIKTELEHYIRDNLPLCINNFEDLQGLSVAEEGNLTITNMILKDDSISIEFDYPLMVNQKTELRKFLANYDFRLGKIYSAVKALINESQNVPSMMCLSCYINAGFQNNMKFDTVELGRYNVVIARDETTRTPLNFAYAIMLAPK